MQFHHNYCVHSWFYSNNRLDHSFQRIELFVDSQQYELLEAGEWLTEETSGEIRRQGEVVR